jgi:hypothetical protein
MGVCVSFRNQQALFVELGCIGASYEIQWLDCPPCNASRKGRHGRACHKLVRCSCHPLSPYPHLSQTMRQEQTTAKPARWLADSNTKACKAQSQQSCLASLKVHYCEACCNHCTADAEVILIPKTCTPTQPDMQQSLLENRGKTQCWTASQVTGECIKDRYTIAAEPLNKHASTSVR